MEQFSLGIIQFSVALQGLPVKIFVGHYTGFVAKFSWHYTGFIESVLWHCTGFM